MQTKEYKKHLEPIGDIGNYFNSNIYDVNTVNIGKVSLPTGQLIARDPFTMGLDDINPYIIEVPKGEYDIELSVLDKNIYVAARVKFYNKKSSSYILALTGEEDLKNMTEGEFFGFDVESGLATITDELVYSEINSFIKKWESKNTNLDIDIYNDYFLDKFKSSYKKYPKYQEENGDYIIWKVPGTDYSVPIFGAGMGKGTYPSYFGYDNDGNLVEFITQFMLL